MHVGELNLRHEHGSQCIEKDLECGKKGLPKDVGQQHGLEISWKISVVLFVTKKLVMQLMVWLERGRVWDPNGEVGEDGEDSVVDGFLEPEIVGQFVDAEETVLVCKATDTVSCQQKVPAERMRVPQEVGADQLCGNNGKGNVLCKRLVARQLEHLGVFLDNQLPPHAVGVLSTCPEEVLRLSHDSMERNYTR